MQPTKFLLSLIICLLTVACVNAEAGTITFINSLTDLESRGSGTSDIRVSATATPGALQFGDLAAITLNATNLGPDDQLGAIVFTPEFIRGLTFPLAATCNIELLVQRNENRGFTDFLLLWIIDDFIANQSLECVITFQVSSIELGTEDITFMHTEIATDPNPTNNEATVTFQYLGLNGVPVPTLSAIGALIFIAIITLIAVFIRPRIFSHRSI